MTDTANCSFCASTRTRIKGWWRRQVRCQDCSARGPRYTHVMASPATADEMAAKAWASVSNRWKIERVSDGTQN